MINLKLLNVISAIGMLFSINCVNAQLPSSDPAYALVWADSFPNTVPNSVIIDTSKWNQIWTWNQSDSVAFNSCDIKQ